MRPLDHKLKYQIDKLVRTAVTGSLGKTDVSSSDLTFIFGLEFHERVDLGHMTNIRPSFHVSQASVYKNVFCFCWFLAENDPLQLRPNPENLISKVRPTNHHKFKL